MPPLAWLDTGTSSDFGEQFVHSILAKGDHVIATARRGHERLQHLKDAGAGILELDVTAPQTELDAKVEEALSIHGGVDVLVNNAGYVEAALVEELELRKAFETNLFRPINLTRSLLPRFREKRKGIILFMSSIRAYTGAAGAGAYSATKGALEIKSTRHGRSSLEQTSPFGIQCCLITPSYYRTNIKIGRLSIPDYADINKLYKAGVSALHNTQQGDPRKAADHIVDMVRSEGKAEGKTIPAIFRVGADAV